MPLRPSRWIFTVLLAAWSLLVAAQDSDVRALPLRTHSLATPYLDGDMSNRWFDYGGSTVIRTDQYVRLTSEHASQAGWIFSRTPLSATNWEIEVEFKISGTRSLFGDGMAMWVTKDRAEMGPVFGMKDRFEGLGLFFDTYKNNRPGTVFPYVMAMIGDGQTTYDQANDGKANERAGCSARGLRNADMPTKVKVTYFQDKLLRVELQYKEEDEWEQCFEIADVQLPSMTYLGFSAETGELSDNHDIIRVDAKNLYSPSGRTGSSGNKETGRRRRRRQGGQGTAAVAGWLWFFAKSILFLVGAAVAGYVGFTAYRARRRDRF